MRLTKLLAIATVGFLFNASAFALGHQAGSFSIAPSMTKFNYASGSLTNNSATGSVILGYDLTNNLSANVQLAWDKTSRSDVTNRDAHVGMVNFDGEYHFANHHALQPFILAGVGALYMKPNGQITTAEPNGDLAATQATINGGLGVEYFLDNRVALRADARDVFVMNKARNNVVFDLGLVFMFHDVKAPDLSKFLR